MGNISQDRSVKSRFFLLPCVALAVILCGCGSKSSGPATYGREFDFDPAFPHSVGAVEVAVKDIQVSGESVPSSEAELAEVLGVVPWKFNVKVPPNIDTLGVSIDLIRTGEPVKYLDGVAMIGPYQFKNLGKTGSEIPILIAISPAGELQKANLLDSPSIRIFIKTPSQSGPRIVPNPFYGSTNGCSTYLSGYGTTSRLLAEIGNSISNEIDVHFRVFVNPDTNTMAAAAGAN
jgi:hypothetical protein